MLRLSVERFMSLSPYTVHRDLPLTAAHRLMHEQDIRHLPVVDRGHLIGVVSERDVRLLGNLRDVDLGRMTVEDAMKSDIFVVRPTANVQEVAYEMATRKLGTAIVVDPNKIVVGVFTTADAMEALVGALTPAAQRGTDIRAHSDTREVRAGRGSRPA